MQVFSSWGINCCVTANMKMIKSQSEPNQSYSPWGALHTMSSKTAPIIVSFVVVCNEGVLIMVIGLGVQFRLVQSQV